MGDFGLYDTLDESGFDDGGCVLCGGNLNYLGTLGRRAWFRCRNCGMDSSMLDHGEGARTAEYGEESRPEGYSDAHG